MARLPPNMRHNLIMDHGTVKSGMSSRTRQQVVIILVVVVLL